MALSKVLQKAVPEGRGLYPIFSVMVKLIVKRCGLQPTSADIHCGLLCSAAAQLDQATAAQFRSATVA